jgi:hypothetical protein
MLALHSLARYEKRYSLDRKHENQPKAKNRSAKILPSILSASLVNTREGAEDFFLKKKPPMMRSECEIIRVIPRPPQSIDIEDFAPSGRWWYCSSWFHVDNACRPRWRRREATPRDGGCAEQKRYYNARAEKIGIHPPLSFFTRSPVAHSHSVSLSL